MGLETHIYCDKCGKGRAYYGAMSKGTATMLMRDKGWSVGKQWICPDCKRRKRKEK